MTCNYKRQCRYSSGRHCDIAPEVVGVSPTVYGPLLLKQVAGHGMYSGPWLVHPIPNDPPVPMWSDAEDSGQVHLLGHQDPKSEVSLFAARYSEQRD